MHKYHTTMLHRCRHKQAESDTLLSDMISEIFWYLTYSVCNALLALSVFGLPIGDEFDMVILSMVRSLPDDEYNETVCDQGMAARKFGIYH